MLPYTTQANTSKLFSWRKTDAAIGTILFKYSPKNHAFVDPIRLKSVFGNVTHAADGLFKNSKVKLSLAAHVVLERIGNSNKRILAGGEEDLRGADSCQE